MARAAAARVVADVRVGERVGAVGGVETAEAMAVVAMAVVAKVLAAKEVVAKVVAKVMVERLALGTRWG